MTIKVESTSKTSGRQYRVSAPLASLRMTVSAWRMDRAGISTLQIWESTVHLYCEGERALWDALQELTVGYCGQGRVRLEVV